VCQISIIPNSSENRILVAAGSYLFYYSVSSTFAFTLLQSISETFNIITAVQYNPNDPTRFLDCSQYNGIRSYLITNDYATP
jgi:hypothetical protein